MTTRRTIRKYSDLAGDGVPQLKGCVNNATSDAISTSAPRGRRRGREDEQEDLNINIDTTKASSKNGEATSTSKESNRRRASRGVSSETKNVSDSVVTSTSNEQLSDVVVVKDEEVEAVVDYDRIREENIRRNQLFLRDLGLEGMRSDMEVAAAKSRSASTQGDRATQARRSKRARQEEGEGTIRRSSRVATESIRSGIERLVREAAVGTLTTQQAEELETLQTKLKSEVGEGAALGMIASAQDIDYGPKRKEGAELPLKDVSDMADDIIDSAHAEVIALMQGLHIGTSSKAASSKATTSNATTSKATKGNADISNTTGEDAKRGYTGFGETSDYSFVAVTKVTKERITATYLHPSEHKTIAIAGDKSGNIGIWDVNASDHAEDAEEKVYYYKPFSSNVCGISVPPSEPSRVWLASYDGTIRCLDTSKEALVLGFKTPINEYEDGGMYLTDVAFGHDANMHHGGPSSDHIAYVARSDGVVAAIDLRSGSSDYLWRHQTNSGK